MSSYGGRAPMLNAVLCTETVIAAIFVAARVFTRKWLLRAFGWDDFLLVWTVIFLAIYSGLIAAGTRHGIGQKRADIDPAEYIVAMKFEVIGQAVCIFNIAISKGAVAAFLLRLVIKSWHKIFLWFCIVTNTIIATFTTIAVLIQCFPIQSIWDTNIKGNCWLDFTTVGLICSAYAVAMDFTLAIAPLAIIWELKMKRKDKFMTAIGLSLGIFAGICGVMRTTALTSMRSYDEYIYDTVDMLIYSGTENFVCCICASVPILRPLYVKVRRGYTTNDDSEPRSYHLSDYDSHRDRGLPGRSKDGIETRIYSQGRGKAGALTENGSEETILRETRGNKDDSGNVICHTEIRVDYGQQQGQEQQSQDFQRNITAGL